MEDQKLTPAEPPTPEIQGEVEPIQPPIDVKEALDRLTNKIVEGIHSLAVHSQTIARLEHFNDLLDLVTDVKTALFEEGKQQASEQAPEAPAAEKKSK
jgi:hypothetical protein